MRGGGYWAVRRVEHLLELPISGHLIGLSVIFVIIYFYMVIVAYSEGGDYRAFMRAAVSSLIYACIFYAGVLLLVYLYVSLAYYLLGEVTGG